MLSPRMRAASISPRVSLMSLMPSSMFSMLANRTSIHLSAFTRALTVSLRSPLSLCISLSISSTSVIPSHP